MARPSARTFGVASLLGAVALWSGSLSIVRVAVASASPGTVTFWRCAVGAVLLGAWAFLGGRLTHRAGGAGTGRPWAWAAASGATCGAAFLLIAVGMRDVGSGPAGIVLSAIPGLTLLLAAIDGSGEQFAARHAVALGLGAVGAVTLALPAGGGWSMAGLGWLALAALAHAATNVTSGHSLRDLDPVAVAAASMGVAALVAMPFASFDSALSTQAIVAIALLGILPSGVAYVLYFHGIRVLGTTSAAYSNFIVPPVAVVAGMVMLGERPAAATFAALALAMAALHVGLGDGRRARPVPVRVREARRGR